MMSTMKKIFPFIFILMFLQTCSQTSDSDSRYPRWVGDIAYDPALDDPAFKVCNEKKARQYFNFSQGLQYEGEKAAILQAFEENYQPPADNQQSGWIRIRFIVNCKGETGRFRLIGASESYEEQTFDKGITGQLMSITKNLSGWKLMPDEERPGDYYQYLLFKIDNGKIIEILP